MQEIANKWALSLKSCYEADITGLSWNNTQCTFSDESVSEELGTESVLTERFPYDYPAGSTEATSTFQQTVTRSTSSRCTVSRAVKLGAATEVTVGFSSLIGGKLQLNGELDLSRTRETTVESREEWMCSKTYPVYPQTVAVLEVLVHVWICFRLSLHIRWYFSTLTFLVRNLTNESPFLKREQKPYT